ncbi:MAG: hypothetical protein EXR71_17415 [Myxococcales bacterium]|nr:hypothetical protein [Myxococcales bacterium]
MNSEFGFVVQALSVFNAMNIEFGCALQPNSRFNNVNIEFGCPAVWEGEHVWLPAQLSGGVVVAVGAAVVPSFLVVFSSFLRFSQAATSRRPRAA